MKKYLYSINNNVLANELCKYEMECIFNDYDEYIFSDINVSSNKSVFIKEKMNILFSSNTFEGIVEQIKETQVRYETFKMTFMRISDDGMHHADYLANIIELANSINGEGDLKTPEYLLAIAKINNVWYFGHYEKNDYAWKINNQKPFSYSNAMSADLSRSIINIATCNDNGTKIIDPCCGVGTVIIDGLMQGVNIEGVEINDQIGLKAQKNLGYMELDQVIIIGDMHDITKYYDVSILDIPYGIMSITDTTLQQDLINGCFKISDKLVLVSSENLNHMIEMSGYNIIKEIAIKKHNNAKFSRYVTVCSK